MNVSCELDTIIGLYGVYNHIASTSSFEDKLRFCNSWAPFSRKFEKCPSTSAPLRKRSRYYL